MPAFLTIDVNALPSNTKNISECARSSILSVLDVLVSATEILWAGRAEANWNVLEIFVLEVACVERRE